MMFIPHIGDRISNGAIIVDLKKSWESEPDTWVALCLWTEDRQQVEPIKRISDLYVTWRIYLDADGLVQARNGHYHDQLSEAVVDFDSRI